MASRDMFLPNYSIGDTVYDEVTRICSKYGRKIVFIGGKTALSKAEQPIKEAIKDGDFEITGTLWYGGEASFENVEMLKKEKAVQEADMIFAVGGGKALDTCKALSEQLGMSMFSFPTIASTCAAITKVCIMYTPAGVMDKFFWRTTPAEHTFINTKIIAEAPAKYLWAGIGDTIAKGYEPEFASRGVDLDYSNTSGIIMTALCKEPVLKCGAKALIACRENRVSTELEEAILAIIVSTGLVSVHVINDYNSCVGHAICYGFSTMPKVEHNHLHGELVSYGLLVELMIDKNTAEIDKLIKFYNELGLPFSYTAFGVKREELGGVIAKAAVVSNAKAVKMTITEELIANAIDELEAYVNSK